MQESLQQMLLDSCQIEIQALKPGNVSVYSHGHGMSPEDFFLSAKTIAPILVRSSLAVGERIHAATQATEQAVGCNTNLGIVLLVTPLIRAFESRRTDEPLQTALQRVLDELTTEDARQTFEAICIASPGGLGKSERYDVRDTPVVNLLQAMQAAADRDTIARQYSNGFADIFSCGISSIKSHLKAAGECRWEWRWAAVNCYLHWLSFSPDSHVFRKHGRKTAENIRKRAERVESRMKACENRQLIVPLLLQFDSALKREEINPGTSADLTVASLLAYQMEHLISHDNKG